MLDEIITGEEYFSGDPVELIGATYQVVGITTVYGGKVQLQLRRLTPRAADLVCTCREMKVPGVGVVMNATGCAKHQPSR